MGSSSTLPVWSPGGSATLAGLPVEAVPNNETNKVLSTSISALDTQSHAASRCPHWIVVDPQLPRV
jgi:hypothetical protein